MEQARCKSWGGRSPLRESFPSQESRASPLSCTRHESRHPHPSSLRIIIPPSLEVTRNDSHQARTSRRLRPFSSGGIWISKSSGTSVSVTACLLRAFSLGDSPCTVVSISSGFPILDPPSATSPGGCVLVCSNQVVQSSSSHLQVPLNLPSQRVWKLYIVDIHRQGVVIVLVPCTHP